jgi:Mycobacterium 19 kDa lipoprotein antigen
MRCVTPVGQMTTLSAALLFVTLVGCSSNEGPPQDTTVVFDGQAYTIHAPVSCAVARNDKLIINSADGRTKLIRVTLTRDYPLVVHAVGFRHLNVRGFTDNENDVWATKVDNTYTISGRMPPGEDETRWHQFTIDVTCLQIEEFTPVAPDQPRGPRMPRPVF